ncbi:helix-turn-helix domain-containing protein [Hyphomicrobium sp.]|uniref:helix-turn-helix domain-containing protein n=1 Tax=Hyphomicrobium sp. TaxID=82 RepID=UPI003563DF19
MDLTKLKEIRKMRKISIKDLSKQTGINRDRISLIERGVVNPSFKTVEAIAEAIGAKIILTL